MTLSLFLLFNMYVDVKKNHKKAPIFIFKGQEKIGRGGQYISGGHNKKLEVKGIIGGGII